MLWHFAFIQCDLHESWKVGFLFATLHSVFVEVNGLGCYICWAGIFNSRGMLITAPKKFGWSGRSGGWGLPSQASATQLGCFITSTGLFLFSPAHYGNCRGGSPSIYHERSLPSELLGGFLAVKSIDQHLKLGPTPLSQLTGHHDLTFFSAHLQHSNRSPPALLATLAFWYNYD